MKREHVEITLGANVSKADQALKGFGGQLEGIVSGWGSAIGGAFAVDKIIDKIGEGISEVRAKAKELTHLNEVTGLNVETIQQWIKDAGKMGIEADQATTSLIKLTQTLGEAAEGGEKAKVFEKMGIDLRDSTGEVRDMNDVLPEVAKKIMELHTPAERAQKAFELFGKAGAKMIPILKDLAEGNGAFGSDKGIISQQTNDRIESLNHLLLRLKTNSTKVFGGIAAALGGALDPSEDIRRNVERAREKGSKAHMGEVAKELQTSLIESGKTVLEFYDSLEEGEKKSTFALIHENQLIEERASLTKAQAEAEKASEQRAMKRAGLAEKVLILEEKQKKLQVEATKLHAGTGERLHKETEILNAQAALQEAIKASEKATADEKKKAGDEEIKRLEQRKKHTDAIADAEKKVADAKGNVAASKKNFDTMSVSEIAALSTRGQSASAQDQIFAARDALSLDQQIKQARLDKESDSYINGLIEQRGQLTGGISAANESERFPFKAVNEELVKQTTALQVIIDKGIPITKVPYSTEK